WLKWNPTTRVLFGSPPLKDRILNISIKAEDSFGASAIATKIFDVTVLSHQVATVGHLFKFDTERTILDSIARSELKFKATATLATDDPLPNWLQVIIHKFDNKGHFFPSSICFIRSPTETDT